MMSCSVFLWAWSWKQSSLQRFGCFIDERSNLLISSKLEEKSTNWEVALYSKKMKIKQSYSRTNTKWNDDFTAWIIDSLGNQCDTCVFSVLNMVLSILLLLYAFFIRISHQYFHINLVIPSREFTHHKFCTTTLNWSSRWLIQSSFAQWHYHSLWRSTEAWWLLIENFSQYPARRREIPTAMQCLEDLLRSTINNESV